MKEATSIVVSMRLPLDSGKRLRRLANRHGDRCRIGRTDSSIDAPGSRGRSAEASATAREHPRPPLRRSTGSATDAPHPRVNGSAHRVGQGRRQQRLLDDRGPVPVARCLHDDPIGIDATTVTAALGHRIAVGDPPDHRLPSR